MKLFRGYCYILILSVLHLNASSLDEVVIRDALEQISERVDVNSRYQSDTVTAFDIEIGGKNHFLYLKEFELPENAHQYLEDIKLKVNAALSARSIGDALILTSNVSTSGNITIYGALDRYFFQTSGAAEKIGSEIIDATIKSLSPNMFDHDVEHSDAIEKAVPAIQYNDSAQNKLKPSSSSNQIDETISQPSDDAVTHIESDIIQNNQDADNTWLYILLGILALGGIAYFALRKKR